MDMIHKCENCICAEVCKYREEYETAVNELLESKSHILQITVSCKWLNYDPKMSTQKYIF